jgi:SulP family sulfate permease
MEKVFGYQEILIYMMIGLVLLTIAIVLLFPKVSKSIPASLVAIIIVLIGFRLGYRTKTVADIASISGGFPPFMFQIFLYFRNIAVNFPYALVSVGLTEGLLTLNLVDEITGTKGQGNREYCTRRCQYFKWFLSLVERPMIAQTLVNLSAGSRARLSGIVAALTILLYFIWSPCD